jgi:cathepsin C
MAEIMNEIYRNGPIVMNFEPKYDFMHYGGGVYHSDSASQAYSTPEWEKVDHSVLAYGWGEENGEKFWLIQNSWGPNWGENGNFRMRRGTDESAIESMAESADPEIVANRNVNKSFL